MNHFYYMPAVLQPACLPPALRWFVRSAARYALLCLTAVSVLLLSGQSGLRAEEAGFQVKPSDVIIPQDAELGSYRRIIHPFENWTLICDEDLKKLRKICNIQQDIMAASGAVVFSWLLAATDSGRPMMILKAPPRLGKGGKVTLTFSNSNKFDVTMDSCTAQICTGMAPVGPQIRAHISENSPILISYRVAEFGVVTLEAPMKGLSAALAAIQ